MSKVYILFWSGGIRHTLFIQWEIHPNIGNYFRFSFLYRLFIKGGVDIVNIFLPQPVLGQAKTLAEVINLSNGRSALEPQGI